MEGFTEAFTAGFTPFQRQTLWAVVVVALLGSAYAVLLRTLILRQDSGTDAMKQMETLIASGTRAYLGQQARLLAIAAVLLAVLVGASAWFVPPSAAAVARFGADSALLWMATGQALGLLGGALLPYAFGTLAMHAATAASVRTAAAARKGYNQALQPAYRTGTLGGMLTASLGLLLSGGILLAYGAAALPVLVSMAAGAALAALCMRMGGGIAAQAADVSAAALAQAAADEGDDEQATTAHHSRLAGRNVSSAAGTMADLFGSFELTTAAAVILGVALGDWRFALLPLLLRAIGVLAALPGSLLVRTDERRRNARAAMNRGLYVTAVLAAVGFAAVCFFTLADPDSGAVDWRPCMAALVGIVLALVTDRLTSYFTATTYQPVKQVSQSSREGAAQNILAGLSLGYEASAWAVVMLALAILASLGIYANEPAASRFVHVLYGVAMTGIGMLALASAMIARQGAGVVADNARHIGELVRLDKNARNVTSDLDAIGTMTRSTTRSVATGLAALAAVATLGALLISTAAMQDTQGLPTLAGINILSPDVLIGLLVGSIVPMLTSSLAIRAVFRTAASTLQAVQHQRTASSSEEEEAPPPDYAAVVRQSTASAQPALLAAGSIAVLLPLLLGLLLSVEALGGFLAGLLLTAHLMALLQASAGGALQHARRYIEDGHVGGKNSAAHQHAIVGDAVGQPLQESAGPAMSVLLHLAAITTLLVAPIIVVVRLPGEPPGIAAIIISILCLVGLVWAVWQASHHATLSTTPPKKATR